jgi:prenylcysteine alpha-carboxyl methylesterase
MNLMRLLCWTVPIFLWNGLRLFLFVVSLTPGFFCFAWFYFIAADRTSIPYGQESVRQTLDVYRPSVKHARQGNYCPNDDNPQNPDENHQDQQSLLQPDTDVNSDNIPPPAAAPVLIFYTGGGWMIGYKMWGSLLARALTAAGVMVVIPDMRNYPWATVPDMVQDVDKSLQWTIDHIQEYGGDPNKIVVVGQSAGGHVLCMAILEKLRGQVLQKEVLQTSYSDLAWLPTDLKGITTISSPFNLQAMSKSFEKKGLDDHLVNRIFGNEMDQYDPFLALQELQQSGNIALSETDDSKLLPTPISSLQDLLPPVRIYHGSADMTVPLESSRTFYQELQKSIPDENRLSFVSYSGWSHTDPILEGPMDANQSLHQDLFNDLVGWTNSALVWPAEDPIIKDRLCPQIMIQAARFFNPF